MRIEPHVEGSDEVVTGWYQETVALSRQIRTLQERIDHLERVRWWHLRRRWDARTRRTTTSLGPGPHR